MVEIIPAVLTSDPQRAREMVLACDGITQRVQIDIIDGIFANNKTIDPIALKGLDVFLGLDFHLMVKEPINWIEKCMGIGADRVIGQIEMMESQSSFVEKVESKNLRVGLAIDLNTPLIKIDPTLFEKLDVVLVMSVEAGFGGQRFNKEALKKVIELNKIRINKKTPFRICVDGGETEDVIDDTYWAGADEIAIGQRLFKGSIKDNINTLKEAAIK